MKVLANSLIDNMPQVGRPSICQRNLASAVGNETNCPGLIIEAVISPANMAKGTKKFMTLSLIL